MSMGNWKSSVAVLFAALALITGSALADEKADAKMAKANEKLIAPLPAAVQATAREQSKGAVIKEVVEEIDAGNKVFEISMRVNGRVKDILVAQDGTVLIVEEQVDLASLPEAVRATIQKNAAKKKIVVINNVFKSGEFLYYEAQLKSGSKLSEIKVAKNGDLVPEDSK